jgi:hypothetical protein
MPLGFANSFSRAAMVTRPTVSLSLLDAISTMSIGTILMVILWCNRRYHLAQ